MSAVCGGNEENKRKIEDRKRMGKECNAFVLGYKVLKNHSTVLERKRISLLTLLTHGQPEKIPNLICFPVIMILIP